jgi:hypothetical protein
VERQPITTPRAPADFGGAKVLQERCSRCGRANSTTITTANEPIDPPPPRSEPAQIQHVGSISTAYGALSRRRSPQCLQQDSFGTTPAHPPPADSCRELRRCICGFIMIFGGFAVSIDMMADELDDTARGFDIELLCRGSCFFAPKQRPPHRRHRLRYRIDRVVLADVRPQRRCHDTRGRRVSDVPARL